MSAVRTALFLCSGNYYRSRFAEIIFNEEAARAGLPWRADSRALGIGRGDWVNEGPISELARQGLSERGIGLPEDVRYPIQVCAADAAGCAVIIALKESEHRPLVEELLPHDAHRVEYWHVHDRDLCEPTQAMAQIEQHVLELIARLAANGQKA